MHECRTVQTTLIFDWFITNIWARRVYLDYAKQQKSFVNVGTRRRQHSVSVYALSFVFESKEQLKRFELSENHRLQRALCILDAFRNADAARSSSERFDQAEQIRSALNQRWMRI